MGYDSISMAMDMETVEALIAVPASRALKQNASSVNSGKTSSGSGSSGVSGVTGGGGGGGGGYESTSAALGETTTLHWRTRRAAAATVREQQ